MSDLKSRPAGTRVLPGCACVLLLLALAAPAIAQEEADLRLPIALDADSADLDRKTSMLVYRGLKLTQGSIGVQADVGRASNLDFQNSTWHLSGNVIIDARTGQVQCETAELKFEDDQLKAARITGSPATFELRRPDSEVVTYAEAQNLFYDFNQGVVEFSGDAVITEGGNRIASDYLVYNIEAQRIKAQSAGEGKVRIKYTPSDADDSQGGEGSADGSGEGPEDPEN